MAEANLTKKPTGKSTEQALTQGQEQAADQAIPAYQLGLLSLQRGAGNRTVGQFLHSVTEQTPSSGSEGMVQRKCDCTSGCGKCGAEDDSVQSKSSLPISHPGDRYEQEADSVADRVMRNLSPAYQVNTYQGARGLVMTKREAGELSNAPTGLSRQSLLSQASGHSLPEGLRNRFEDAFGHDFGGVRIHSNSSASKLAQSIHSEAFTHGKDIFFNSGRYNPTSLGGQKLLAHELTHVIQQGASKQYTDRTANSLPGQIQRVTTPGYIQRSPCLPHITRNGLRSVCRRPPTPAAVGRAVHTDIQNRFRRPPDQLTELQIPGSGGVCRDVDLLPLPGIGKADLVRVIHRGPRVVSIDIAEIKPMNIMGAGAGLTQAACYAEKINDPVGGIGNLCATMFTPDIARRVRRLRRSRDLANRRPSERLDLRNLIDRWGLPIIRFCERLGALGKRVRARATLRLRPRRLTLPTTPPKRVLVRTCLPGVIGYTCLERPQRRRRRRRRSRARRRPSRSLNRRQLRRLARLRALRRRLVRRSMRALRRVLRRAGVKAAGRLLGRLIPVLGWVLLAVDIAEAADKFSRGARFGIGEDSESGNGESGAVEGQAGDSAAEGRQGGQGGPGGSAAEGGAEGGGATAESAQGEGATGNAGGAAREGSGSAHGIGEHEGEGEGEGGAEASEQADQSGGDGGTGATGGASRTQGEATQGEGGAAGLEFLTDDEINSIVEELDLSPELIDGLRNSSPQQQALLDMMLTNLTSQDQPRVNESFFVRALEITSGMTTEELTQLQENLRPVQDETPDEILEQLEQALRAVRQTTPERTDQQERGEANQPGADQQSPNREAATEDAQQQNQGQPPTTATGDTQNQAVRGQGEGRESQATGNEGTEGVERQERQSEGETGENSGPGTTQDGDETSTPGPQYVPTRDYDGPAGGSFPVAYGGGLTANPSVRRRPYYMTLYYQVGERVYRSVIQVLVTRIDENGDVIETQSTNTRHQSLKPRGIRSDVNFPVIPPNWQATWPLSVIRNFGRRR